LRTTVLVEYLVLSCGVNVSDSVWTPTSGFAPMAGE
jgi:hypothetical protein